MAPELSVVIPSHSRPDLLAACLRSVVRHVPPGSEVLVVDDGSPGGRVTGLAREFGVGALRLPRRRGFCVAANAGIAATRGRVVELLNDDAEVTAGWAEPALAAFADPVIGAVAPLVLVGPSGRGRPRVDSAGDSYDLGGFARKRGHGEPLAARHLAPGLVFGASASSGFYRRAALERAGTFPESFGAYYEDVDLAFRLRRAGYKVFYEPASLVYHRVSASYGRRDRRLLARQSQNEERVFWRNVPADKLRAAIPRHVAVLAGKVWLRWQDGTLASFLCGRLRALAEWPAFAAHRRTLDVALPASAACFNSPIENR